MKNLLIKELEEYIFNELKVKYEIGNQNIIDLEKHVKNEMESYQRYFNNDSDFNLSEDDLKDIRRVETFVNERLENEKITIKN